MHKILIITSMVVMFGFGCKKREVKDQGLLEYKWVLNYIQDTRNNEVINYPGDAARKITIVFDDSSGIISFKGICNDGSGSYSFTSIAGEIKITNMMTTLIGCKYVEWETYTVQNLYYATGYKINGDNLTIYSTGEYNLYFTKS